MLSLTDGMGVPGYVIYLFPFTLREPTCKLWAVETRSFLALLFLLLYIIKSWDIIYIDVCLCLCISI